MWLVNVESKSTGNLRSYEVVLPAPPSQAPSLGSSSKGIRQSDRSSLLLSLLLSHQHEVWRRLGSRRRLLQVSAAHALHPLPAAGHPPAALPPAQLCLGHAPSPLCQPGGHGLAPGGLPADAAGRGRGLVHSLRWEQLSTLSWRLDLRPIPVHFHHGHRGRAVYLTWLSVWKLFFPNDLTVEPSKDSAALQENKASHSLCVCGCVCFCSGTWCVVTKGWTNLSPRTSSSGSWSEPSSLDSCQTGESMLTAKITHIHTLYICYQVIFIIIISSSSRSSSMGLPKLIFTVNFGENLTVIVLNWIKLR